MLFLPMKSYTFYMPLLFGGYAETRLRYSGSFTTAASYCSCCSKCVKKLLTKPEK